MSYDRATWEARDPWSASYLYLMDVPLHLVYVNRDGKVRWLFEAQGDRAYRYAMEWRHEENATVNGPAMMRAYREISRRASDARAHLQGVQADDRPNS